MKMSSSSEDLIKGITREIEHLEIQDDVSVKNFKEYIGKQEGLTKEEIESLIEKVEYKEQRVNHSNLNKVIEIDIPKKDDENDLDYPEYNHSEDFTLGVKSWKEINPDNLEYPEWLVKEGLPRFWIQPRPDLQHPILAAICMLNTSAIPAWTAKARKEAQLPIPVFSGESRSGKTEGFKFVMQSYAPSRRDLIKADSTGTTLRNMCHRLCWDSRKETIVPATLLIDNFEKKFIDKWGDFKTLLLSVLRSQSVSYVASREGGEIPYYCHLLKAFTTVETVKAFTKKESEFYNRMIFFFTERQPNVKSIANYDFSDIPHYYLNLWNPDRVKTQWYPILRSLLLKDDDETTIPAYRWMQSLVIMATGIYSGIWESEEEAIELMTEYWKWVEEIERDISDDIELLIKERILEETQKKYNAKVGLYKHKSEKEFKNLTSIFEVTINASEFIQHIQDKCISTSNIVIEKVKDYMAQKKWLLINEDSNLFFVKTVDIDKEDLRETLHKGYLGE